MNRHRQTYKHMHETDKRQ